MFELGIELETCEMTKYAFPVYGTQGGGLARKDGDKFFFVEAPDEIMNLKVGDEVPHEWGIVPANEHAHNEEYALDMKGTDPELVELFQLVLDGRLTWDDVKDSVPEKLHDEIKQGLGIQ
jgi:hypothetical protein